MVCWVHRVVRGLDGPANTNTTHRPPTFQCDAMRISARWVCGSPNKIKYLGVNDKYVCKKNNQPRMKNNHQPQMKNNQQCKSSTTLSANKLSVFTTCCIYYCTDSRSIFFQLKMVGRAETFESCPSEKGVNSK